MPTHRYNRSYVLCRTCANYTGRLTERREHIRVCAAGVVPVLHAIECRSFIHRRTLSERPAEKNAHRPPSS